MAKMRGAHSFRLRVCQGPTPPTVGPSPIAAGPFPTTVGFPAADPAAAGPATIGSVTAGPSAIVEGADPRVPATRPTADAASPAPAAGDVEGSSSMAPTQRRYHTRVGPTPPSPSHPRLDRRAPPAKRARTSGQGESSTSRSRAPPSPPYQGIVGAPNLSPRSIIR